MCLASDERKVHENEKIGGLETVCLNSSDGYRYFGFTPCASTSFLKIMQILSVNILFFFF